MIARSAPARGDAAMTAVRLVAIIALLAAALGPRAAPVHGSAALLITVGEVTDTTAVLWTRSEADGEVVAEVTAAASPEPLRAHARTTPEADFTAKLVLRGLQPATGYQYRVSSRSSRVDGRFVTAPAHREARSVRFVWSGDLGGGRHCRRVGDGYSIFRAMATRRPAFFIFAGDTVYADHRCAGPGVAPGADFVARSLPDFHRKHRHNREDPAVQAFLRQTSVYAVWDDHEVRNNFAAATEPLAPIGLRAFLDYWPITPPEEDGTRLYRAVRWGRLVELFILDTRQYRDAVCLDSSDKTMLGAAQRRWLIDGVAASDAVWKLVVSSVPFSVAKGGPCGDSWAPRRFLGLRTGYATERDALIDAWRRRAVRNVVVLAADVHYAALLRHRPVSGFTFHELIAGPLAAIPKAPGKVDADLGAVRLFAVGGRNNFGEIEVDATMLTARIVGERGEVLGARTISAEDRPGR